MKIDGIEMHSINSLRGKWITNCPFLPVEVLDVHLSMVSVIGIRPRVYVRGQIMESVFPCNPLQTNDP